MDSIPAEYGVVMDRLALLRIKLPDRWVILEAAEAILENSAADLVAQQRAAEARIQGEEWKFNNPGNVFAGNGPASAPSNRAAETLKTILHTLEVIRNSEGGIGTVSQRIAGYLEKFGGDLVSSVDVIAKANTAADVQVVGVQETETTAREAVQNTLKERVAARLNERLQSMTMEERAHARGLLRLKEDGKLDEYFASMFSGSASEAVSAELDGAGGYSVFYLIDADVKIVYQVGHAAMLMGSETEGWYYFSFGVGNIDGRGKFLTANGNMDVDFFPTLREAQIALDRYGYYLRWDVKDASSIRSAFREASSHLVSNYGLFTQNCDDIASDTIRAAGVELNDRWIPNLTYLYEKDSADETNSWREIINLSE